MGFNSGFKGLKCILKKGTYFECEREVICVFFFFTLRDDGFSLNPKHLAVKQYQHSCHRQFLFHHCCSCITTRYPTRRYVMVLFISVVNFNTESCRRLGVSKYAHRRLNVYDLYIAYLIPSYISFVIYVQFVFF